MCCSNLQRQYHCSSSSKSLKCLHLHLWDFQKVCFDFKVLLLSKITTCSCSCILLTFQKLMKISIWTETTFSSQALGLLVYSLQTDKLLLHHLDCLWALQVLISAARRSKELKGLLLWVLFLLRLPLKNKLLQNPLAGKKKIINPWLFSFILHYNAVTFRV